jgi:hypothetical protein
MRRHVEVEVSERGARRVEREALVDGAVARAGLKVLCVSGYTGDQLAQVRPGASWGELLQKPFGIDDLARAVRAALGGPGFGTSRSA